MTTNATVHFPKEVMKFTAPRRLHWLLLISAVIIFLDRLTKDWVTRHIHYGDHIPVIPRVSSLSHWTNDGAAFSLFANSSSPQRCAGG